jgi:hypothetical protein
MSTLRVPVNVAVFQPEISGVRLSPIADFMFLKDVSRDGREHASQASGPLLTSPAPSPRSTH